MAQQLGHLGHRARRRCSRRGRCQLMGSEERRWTRKPTPSLHRLISPLVGAAARARAKSCAEANDQLGGVLCNLLLVVLDHLLYNRPGSDVRVVLALNSSVPPARRARALHGSSSGGARRRSTSCTRRRACRDKVAPVRSGAAAALSSTRLLVAPLLAPAAAATAATAAAAALLARALASRRRAGVLPRAATAAAACCIAPRPVRSIARRELRELRRHRVPLPLEAAHELRRRTRLLLR